MGSQLLEPVLPALEGEIPTPGFPVHHHLLELAQTHSPRVSDSDAIQPSYPWLSPSSPALNLSPHQGLFQGIGSSHQVATSTDE